MERSGIAVWWSALLGIFCLYDKRSCNHIMKPLLLFGPSDHHVSDAENQRRKEFSEISSSSSAKRNSISVLINNLQPNRLLTNRRLPFG